MGQLPDPLDVRRAEYPVEPLLLRRWSPRAMSGEPLRKDELMSLFEAARWAPSTYNEQEWRYLYARRDAASWSTFLNLLLPTNQSWCERAAVLMVLLSRRFFLRNGKPNPVHSLDTGASLQNLALQGTALGLVVHPMAGFDREKARQVLSVPDSFSVEAMVAVGRPGDPDDLSDELRAREVPSLRRPINEFAREGVFTFE